MTKLSLYQECEVSLTSEKSTHVIHHTKKIKEQIILISIQRYWIKLNVHSQKFLVN